MVHSAWERAGPLAANPAALIAVLQEAVGPSGTLCMPAYPPPGPAGPIMFDLRRTPSNAGLVSEVFRRMPGALRSRQVRTVASLGPLAEELTGEHHHSPYASGNTSPYAKLADVHGKVLCLGVGPEHNTMFHCAEDLLGSEFPVDVYEGQAHGGSRHRHNWARDHRPELRTVGALDLLLRRGPTTALFCGRIQWREMAGVDAYLMPAAVFLSRLLGLARRGIHMYGFHFPAPRSLE